MTRRGRQNPDSRQAHDSWAQTAAESGVIPAKYLHALECDDPEERKRWLREAAEQGYSPAMCDYALECDDHEERKRLLRDAAHEGYVPAMYYYAMELGDPGLRIRWVKAAADAGYGPAICEYGLLCDDPVDRRRWLQQAGWGRVLGLPSTLFASPDKSDAVRVANSLRRLPLPASPIDFKKNKVRDRLLELCSERTPQPIKVALARMKVDFPARRQRCRGLPDKPRSHRTVGKMKPCTVQGFEGPPPLRQGRLPASTPCKKFLCKEFHAARPTCQFDKLPARNPKSNALAIPSRSQVVSVRLPPVLANRLAAPPRMAIWQSGNDERPF